MPTIRSPFPFAALIATGALLSGCQPPQSGPVRIVAIGPAPEMLNPNRDPITPASALLLDTVAQGLVRFNAAGEIEPALAQSWIVSDDGRRYTFRIRRTLWARGEAVTARQVVERLRATIARNSRNALRPVLGAIDQIEAMTDHVLEIRLKAPRTNFLQLLAQPEMAIVAGNEGTGPFRMAGETDGVLRLIPPAPDEDSDAGAETRPNIMLGAGQSALAIAGFSQGQADLVTGGTLGDAPLLSAVEVARDNIIFDPTRGLFGLGFTNADGPLADARFRHALAMAIDRDAIQERFGLPTLQTRMSLLPSGLSEYAAPAIPDWATIPLATRRSNAAIIVAEHARAGRVRLRVFVPDGPGNRILFAHLRRDWRMIGVDAERVTRPEQAQLRLIDEVAPADLVPWYLRRFACGTSPVCSQEADELLEAARNTRDAAERQALLMQADRLLVGAGAFVSIGQPVRWSLRAPRLVQFRANVFARHSPIELIEGASE